MPAPVSAPSSPLASRHPITPQRISYSSQKTFKHALQQQSPVTPYSLSSTSSWSTPFTPLSANSSNITTPGSSQADNWRKRASQNGIRVKEASNNKNLVTDDNEDASSDVTNPYDEVELPQYRPLHSMPFNTNHLATPPQNARLLSALKRKGVTTAPAPVPHRPFIPSAAYNNSLFDIAEDNSVSYPFELPHASPLAFFSPQVQRRGTGFADVFEFHDQQTFIPDSPMLPASPTACSVCATTSTATLAVLQPCAHALCSACLTSALNIVGEKDMECVACSSVVADFKLVPKAQANSENENSATHVQTNQSSGDEEAFWCGARSSSTPAPVEERPEENTATDQGLTKDPPTVLRIDNVPWSITPPLLTAFLSPPPQRAHVLLSPEGKTLSHAFVEYDSHSEGLAALASARNRIIEGSQGEVRQPSIKGNAGRRRRGVTVTVAGRGELMRALFPSWQGAFDERNRPSLMGLDNYAVRRALEGGLMTPRDMRGLKRLIESPNCHFVKVPTLPFFCLISLLQRFPSDQDSCVFWSHALRDDLFGLAVTAINILRSHLNGDDCSAEGDGLEDPSLCTAVLNAAISCGAFTVAQCQLLHTFSDKENSAVMSSSVSSNEYASSSSRSRGSSVSGPSGPAFPLPTEQPNLLSPAQIYPGSQTKSQLHVPIHKESLGALAQEFGLDKNMVAALAQRLAAMNMQL